MAGTTLANVLAIAPELTDFLSSVAQVVKVTVTAVSDSATYTCTINGNAYTYTTSASATASEITSGLSTAINAGSDPVDVTNNMDSTYTITSTAAGTAFTIEVDSKQSYQTIQSNIDRTSMVNLVLADVGRRVTAGVFGSFQEEAQRYLAAHLFTCYMDAYNSGSGGGGAIKRQKAGEHEIEYQTIISSFEGFNRFDTTKYGQMFNALSKSVVIAPGFYV